MSRYCPEFVRSSNPRHGGCLKCGRIEMVHSEAKPKPKPKIRDSFFEGHALRDIAQKSANPSIEAAAQGRLDWGDREYGDQFNARGDDGIREALDESIDGIAWALLHLQNRVEEGDVREHVMRACVAFAEAHRELQHALELR